MTIYLAVVGSRCLANDPEAQLLIEAAIGEAWYRADQEDRQLVIVSGQARGIDTMAEDLAIACGLGRAIYPPLGPGLKAIEARNREIARRCSELVAVHGSCAQTHGTAWTARFTKQLGKPVREHVV